MMMMMAGQLSSEILRSIFCLCWWWHPIILSYSAKAGGVVGFCVMIFKRNLKLPRASVSSKKVADQEFFDCSLPGKRARLVAFRNEIIFHTKNGEGSRCKMSEFFRVKKVDHNFIYCLRAIDANILSTHPPGLASCLAACSPRVLLLLL